MIIVKLFAAWVGVSMLTLLLNWHLNRSHRKASIAILSLLSDGAWWYGLAIVKASHGATKRGGVYVSLGRLEDEGFVKSRQEEVTPDYIGIPRRMYQISELGRRRLEGVEA